MTPDLHKTTEFLVERGSDGRETRYPKQTIWIAFLNGRVWTTANEKEQLNLKHLSPEDPRLQIKQFVEVL